MGNPAPQKPPSIKDVGLEKYLNDTRDIHNDKGYDDFVSMISAEVPKFTKIAKNMHVSRRTIYRWLDIYDEGSEVIE